MFKMYGTTMKNYNVNKASGIKGVKKSLFAKKAQVKENKKSKKEDDTRYMKFANTEEVKSVSNTEYVENDRAFFWKKDFPIPSVIVTVLMTMMLLVVGVGLLGL